MSRPRLPAQWVELDGSAHIVQQDRFLDKAVCGRPLTDSTMIMEPTTLLGCMDCVCKYASYHVEHRFPMEIREAEEWWW